MKTQAQITDLGSKLNDLQASLQGILESHLKRQHYFWAAQAADRTYWETKSRSEELRKALDQKKDDEIKQRDCQIEKKEQQIQELREGPHLTTNRQNGEERVSPEIVKWNTLEKGFLFFLWKLLILYVLCSPMLCMCFITTTCSTSDHI